VPKRGKSKIPKNPTEICINAKYFNGFVNLSLYFPAIQLPIDNPRIKDATIVDTAKTVAPKTSESGLIHIIS